MSMLRDIGSVVGIAAFIGFSVLLYLYIARARELRSIRQSAPFLADGGTTNGQPEEPSRAAAVRAQRGRDS